jgi:predicted RNase H-related nuclease YkuK (DUF458 family)
MIYKKLYSGEKVDVIEYVKEYMETHNDVEILIGCDSQNFGNKTIYAIVVALYAVFKKAGVWAAEKGIEVSGVLSVKVMLAGILIVLLLMLLNNITLRMSFRK